MPRVGLEPTILVFQGEKTVHALDCAATVLGMPIQFIGPKIHFVFTLYGNVSLGIPCAFFSRSSQSHSSPYLSQRLYAS
jgi:hypothetical protein